MNETTASYSQAKVIETYEPFTSQVTTSYINGVSVLGCLFLYAV